MTVSVNLIPGVRDQLGESPLWDPATDTLYRVDSVAPCVHALDPATGAARRWDMPAPVGSIGLGAPGQLIAALRDGFYDLDLSSGALRPLWTGALPTGNRFNDGKMDRVGRFLCGTMQTEVAASPGILCRLGIGGVCDQLETGIGISNGLCFSPSGDRLYFTDSRVGIIWAYPYDTQTGAVGPRRDWVDTIATTGSPADGATVDADGCLWAALVRTGQVARFTPDGRLDMVIDVPVPHPTCPAFGGKDFDILYVTSISNSGRLRSDHPEAGRLLAITGTGATGLVEARFAD
jgi:L-arabinonolactonase